MTRTYLKKAELTSQSDVGDVQATVQKVLDDIEKGGDEVALEYAKNSTSTKVHLS